MWWNGADTLRVYEMLMGPLLMLHRWSEIGLVPPHRVHCLITQLRKTMALLTRFINLRNGYNVNSMKFNTAIAQSHGLLSLSMQLSEDKLTWITPVVFIQLIVHLRLTCRRTSRWQNSGGNRWVNLLCVVWPNMDEIGWRRNQKSCCTKSKEKVRAKLMVAKDLSREEL